MKLILKQAAKYAKDAAHTNALEISSMLASMLPKGQIMSFDNAFNPEQLINIKKWLIRTTSVLTSHNFHLIDTAVCDDDLQALQSRGQY